MRHRRPDVAWESPAERCTLTACRITVKLTDGENGQLNPLASFLRAFRHRRFMVSHPRGRINLSEWNTFRCGVSPYSEEVVRGLQWVVFRTKRCPCGTDTLNLRLHAECFVRSFRPQPGQAYFVQNRHGETPPEDMIWVSSHRGRLCAIKPANR